MKKWEIVINGCQKCIMSGNEILDALKRIMKEIERQRSEEGGFQYHETFFLDIRKIDETVIDLDKRRV